MNLHRSKIEWCTHTWNPVSGCLNGCPYCYARRQVDRFKPHPCEKPEAGASGTGIEKRGDKCFEVVRPVRLVDENGKYIRSTPWPKGFAPTLYRYEMDYPAKRFIPSRIFVSSMGDLFGDWVPEDWIVDVFEAARLAPQHTYLFLTKNPKRYIELDRAGKLPEDKNFWYGSTVTNDDKPIFFSEKHNCFVSIEPLLGPFDVERASAIEKIKWIIIGAMTGPGSKRHQPQREWIENIVDAAKIAGSAVFMKDSLEPIWGLDLIRQHPDGMVWPEDD